MVEDAQNKKVGVVHKVEKSFMDMKIPVRTATVIIPILFGAFVWWAKVSDLPEEIKDLRDQVIENKSTLALHGSEFKHVHQGIVDIKDLIKEMREDNRRMRYENRRANRNEDQ